MTVNNDISTITYPGNGSTTTFSFPMATPDTDSIQVFVQDSTGVRQLGRIEFGITLNPLIGANPTPQGGTITYNPGGSPLPLGSSLIIARVIEPVQDVSIANQSIIYPPIIEQEFDYLTMLAQQGNRGVDRAIKVPVTDPVPADLPPLPARANQTAFFDAQGNLTAGLPLDNTVMVSAAMQPVVSAATLAQAQTAFGLNKDPRVITTGYVLVPDDDRRLIVAQGAASYLISAGDFSTFPTYFRCIVINNDTRVKIMNIFGYPGQFKVYPDQQVLITRTATAWLISRPGRWQVLGPKSLYVDPALGNDNNDGLVPGAGGAFQTITKAISVQETDLDGDFTIQLADGTYNLSSPIMLNKRLSGSSGYKITGNVATPTNVKIAGPTSGNPLIWFIVSGTAVATLRGMQFVQGPASAAGYCLWALNGGVLNIGDVVFSPTPTIGGHVVCWAGTVNVIGNYHVGGSSNATYHMGSFYNGIINFGTGFGGPPINVTLDGPVQFTPYGWYLSELNATIVTTVAVNYINAGFAVGTQKGIAVYNGIVNAGSSTIPGDLPPSASNGGFFF